MDEYCWYNPFRQFEPITPACYLQGHSSNGHATSHRTIHNIHNTHFSDQAWLKLTKQTHNKVFASFIWTRKNWKQIRWPPRWTNLWDSHIEWSLNGSLVMVSSCHLHWDVLYTSWASKLSPTMFAKAVPSPSWLSRKTSILSVELRAGRMKIAEWKLRIYFFQMGKT